MHNYVYMLPPAWAHYDSIVVMVMVVITTMVMIVCTVVVVLILCVFIVIVMCIVTGPHDACFVVAANENKGSGYMVKYSLL